VILSEIESSKGVLELVTRRNDEQVMDYGPGQFSRIAFYDLDGTLCSGNVVQRYAFYARHYPSRWRAILRWSKLVASLPLLVGLEFYSRRLFNEFFYREYRGMRETWLREMGEELFESVVRPTIFPGSKALVEADRGQGFRPVLVTGELDFAIQHVARYFNFDAVISNTLFYRGGEATGNVVAPLVAEREKAAAITNLCQLHSVELSDTKAYSDSISDVHMLEAVGRPVAVNPDRRLKRVALQRGWPILDLKNGHHELRLGSALA
jgi:HAD superfamily hydrolase (TIGR01490 family)